MTAEELGAALRARRRQLRLRQQDVADLAGVSRRLLIDVESGSAERDPGLRKVLAVCAVLGLELEAVTTRADRP